MNWLGSSFPIAFNRLPFLLAILFLALYVVMLWYLMIRQPKFRALSGRDRWSILTASFGIMTVWMLLFGCVNGVAGFVYLHWFVPYPYPRPLGVLWSRISFIAFVSGSITWPFSAWFVFRIAGRRFDRTDRGRWIRWLSGRIGSALCCSLVVLWFVFHFLIAGGHSFDHLAGFGPRNLGSVMDWGHDEPIDYGDGYRARFPVRDDCPLCRLEPILGRKQAEDRRAKEAEFISHAEFAESESHAESAENAESEVEDDSASRPGEEGEKD